MLASISKVEYRQLIAIPYLLLVLGLEFTGGTPRWEDLYGILGLCLVFVPAMITPRRWLWIAFLFAAAYFLFMGIGSLFLGSNWSWMELLLPAAFLLAAILFLLSALNSKRRLAQKI